MNWLFKYISIKTGTTLFQSIAFLIILGLLIAVIEVNEKIMDALIKQIIEQFAFKTNFQQFKIQTELFKTQADFPITNSFDLLNKLNFLFQFTVPKLMQTELPYICPIQQTNYSLSQSIFINTAQFCIFYKNSEEATDKQIFYPYVEMLNELIIPLISYDLLTLHFTNLEQNYLFAIYPFVYNNSFNPQIRPWYLNHLEKYIETNKNQFITDAYQSYSSEQYLLTLTQSLLNKENQLNGVLAYDLRFSIYSQYLNYLQFSYYFLTINGLIINTNQLNQTQTNVLNQLIYIYDQNQTGFNFHDWKEIIKFAQNKNYTNSCRISVNNLCRYNSKYKEEIILHTLLINENFYFIIFQNVTIQQEYQQLFLGKKLHIVNQFRWLQLYYTIISIILLLFTSIGIYICFRPIGKLKEQLDYQIYLKFSSPNWLSNKEIIKNSQKNSSLLKALTIFQKKMNTINQSKSQHCHLIEKFKYPNKKIHKQIKRICFKLKYLILFLKDENKIIQIQSKIQKIDLIEPQQQYNQLQTIQSLVSETNEKIPIFQELNLNIEPNFSFS